MDDLVNYDRTPLSQKYRTMNDIEARLFRQLEEHGDFDLTQVERSWIEEYDYLLSLGYQLRPRFHPGWTPSWRGTDIPPVACEDSVEHFRRSCIDAKRLKDGKIVAVKRIPPYTLEADIACMLSTHERLRDRMNHCVPIYDCFLDTRNARGGFFIVMHLLRAFNEPPFAYVDEVVDFVRQTLEGLVYIHGHDVAHRDLSDGNIMMDGLAMYGKKGFHPSDQDVRADDALKLAKPKTRRDVGSVRYYFTDFGLSSYFDDPDRRRLVTGNRAQDREIPELSSIVPYDPFAVDIFTLGNVFKRNFLNNYSNLDFLSPLCSAMMERNPILRIRAPEALAMFQQSLRSHRRTALRWRLRPHQESRFATIIGDFCSAAREVVYQIKLLISCFMLVMQAFIPYILNTPASVLRYDRQGLLVPPRRLFKNAEDEPLLG
ncbi:hypothetical protein ACEPAI_4240 [Sanghuangporus weigelae]